MKKAKKLLSLLLALALVSLSLLAFSGCEEEPVTPSPDATAENPIAYLVIENYGLVAIELYADKAPITVANFKKLVNDGFYNGLTFHRIIERFMIQGGDPKGNGTGGSKEDIKGEFLYNGVDTGIKHVEGTISMARSGSGLADNNGVALEEYLYAGYDIPDEYMPYIEAAFNSASSQFFIVTETSANNTYSLDGKYAAFGQVIEGMEHVKAVAKVATDESAMPLSPVKIAIITFDRAEAEAALAN